MGLKQLFSWAAGSICNVSSNYNIVDSKKLGNGGNPCVPHIASLSVADLTAMQAQTLILFF